MTNVKLEVEIEKKIKLEISKNVDFGSSEGTLAPGFLGP